MITEGIQEDLVLSTLIPQVQRDGYSILNQPHIEGYTGGDRIFC